MDKLTLAGLSARVHVGVPEWERRERQTLRLDVELHLDLFPAGRADSPALTADYWEAEKLIRKVLRERRFKLIEAVAEAVALSVLKAFPAVRVVRVGVTKKPKVMPRTAAVTAEIVRRR